MHAIRAVLVIALAALVSACVTSKFPVGASQGEQADARLMGAWTATDPKTGNRMFLFFIPRPSGGHKVEAIGVTPAQGDENGGWGSYAIVVGKAGEHSFINAQPLLDDGKPKSADDYVPVLYTIDRSGRLHFSMLDTDAVKRAVQAGEIQGVVKDSSVLITAAPAALDAYMATRGAALFKPSEIVFKRVE
jgi:hypothetical protein